jgi:hypothetical protein
VMTRCGLACQVIPPRMARPSRPTIAATDRRHPAAGPVVFMALVRLGGHTTLAASVAIAVPRRSLVLTTGPGITVVVCVMCLAATLAAG